MIMFPVYLYISSYISPFVLYVSCLIALLVRMFIVQGYILGVLPFGKPNLYGVDVTPVTHRKTTISSFSGDW
jgi:hypothetical protein